MRKWLVILGIFLIISLLPKVTIAGSADFWKSCCVTGCDKDPGESVTFGGNTYYCCCSDGTAQWYESTVKTCSSYPLNVVYCNKAGESYFADKQNIDCTYSDRGDNICRSSAFASGCTADSKCNGVTAGSMVPDKSGSCDSTCKFHSATSEDSDGDGVRNDVDACPDTYGTWCYGCPQPSCAECKQPYCPSSFGQPSCINKADGTNCGTDGYYCSSSKCKRDYRDYSCKSGACTYSLISSDYTTSDCNVCIGSSWTAVTTSNYCSSSNNNYFGCTIGTDSCNMQKVCTTTNIVTGCVGGVANDICEAGEKQEDCSDCKTIVTLSKQNYLTLNEEVTVTVTFTDGRYKSGEEADVKLIIIPEGCLSESCYVTWIASNGCDSCNKQWKQNLLWNGETTLPFQVMGNTYPAGSPVSIDSRDYFARIQFKAKIPVAGGKYTLIAVPTIYSTPITLKAAQAEINVFDGLFTLLNLMKEIVMKRTGLFLFRA